MAKANEAKVPDAATEQNGSAELKPKNIVEAVNAKKTPPPETAQERWTRWLVIASFWSVVVFFGLPIWFKTTTIYRANLPLQAMNDWADGKVCRPEFPLRIAVQAPSLPHQDAQHLVRTTQHALDDLNDFSAHHLRLLLAEPQNKGNGSNSGTALRGPSMLNEVEDIALSIRLIPGETGSTPKAELAPYASTLDVFYSPNQIPSLSSTSAPLATFLANELQKIFAEEQATLSYLLSSNSNPPTTPPKSLSPEYAETLSKRKTRTLKYAPTYHLTFSLFTPTAAPSAWEIEAALEEFMAPLLESLSPISNFTVDTQVQLYATFSPSIHQPEFDNEKNSWTLKGEDLSGFINAAEWPLSPSIGAGPTVNFVLYVPSSSQSPLVVKENGANSWLLPQWGGVMILNPHNNTTSTPTSLSKDDLRPAFHIFSTQLLSLLGLPESPKSFPLRLSTLTRVRAASLLFSASSTLGSLARLTLALPSISIPDTVSHSVTATLAHLHAACEDLREGRFHSALSNARVAEQEAERAFFEPSMVGQVYFPDEHKVAVYLPLLGPVAVPLVMAVLKEVKNWRERRAAAKVGGGSGSSG